MAASNAKPRLVAIMGPTASGKTELAVELVERFPVDIISVDSAQVYRGLDIGAAKPDAAVLESAPHQLIDLLDPDQSYSAADFVRDASRCCRASWDAGRTPLLVGGTMLYFRALEQGLSPMPGADAQVRETIAAEAEERGWQALHAELRRVDPEAAERIHANDPQRIQRALEVFRVTGQPISRLQSQQGEGSLDAEWLKIIVSPADRAVLHERIERRFGEMLNEGLIDEVQSLRARYPLNADHPSMRSVGYRQVWEHLEGDYDREELERRGIYATRQLAKRQVTWLRKQDDAWWIDPQQTGWKQLAITRIAQFLDLSL